jgi:flagellar biosynthetic protein FlhB
MAEEESKDKESTTQPPSEKRRREFREDGKIPKSREVSTVFTFIGGLFFFFFVAKPLATNLMAILSRFFGGISDINAQTAADPVSLQQIIIDVMTTLMPAFGFFMILAVAAHMAQTGWFFSLKPFEFDISKFNALNKLKQIFFSKDTLLNIGLSVAKATILGWVFYRILKGTLAPLYLLPFSEVAAISSFMIPIVVKLFSWAACVIGVIAVLDYFYQWRKIEKEMMMSPDEIRREMKSEEGDPRTKGRRKQFHKELSMNKILQAVPKADVIITNPTHYAVAIQYDLQKDNAPKVIAKGQDQIALKIREIARNHQIPLMENRPLAQMLYKEVDIGGEIPAQLYKAVAEVLAYVYRLQQRHIKP